MPELISDGETGYLLEDEEKMVEALGLVGKVNRNQCGEWVRAKFSVEQMVDGYERLYQKTVGK